MFVNEAWCTPNILHISNWNWLYLLDKQALALNSIYEWMVLSVQKLHVDGIGTSLVAVPFVLALVWVIRNIFMY